MKLVEFKDKIDSSSKERKSRIIRKSNVYYLLYTNPTLFFPDAEVKKLQIFDSLKIK